MAFGIQETTYVARRKNVKICTTLKRKPCFCIPGTLQKTSQNYLSRQFGTLFGRHSKVFSGHVGGRSGTCLRVNGTTLRRSIIVREGRGNNEYRGGPGGPGTVLCVPGVFFQS